MQLLGDLANQATKQYSIEDAGYYFIRHNENLTYRVTDGKIGEKYVLRIHMPREGFSQSTAQHSYESLRAEMEFLKAIGENTDIAVQKPMLNHYGDYVSKIIDRHNGTTLNATLLSWIEGQTMDPDSEEIEQLAYKTGIMTAKLHSFSASWQKKVARHSYDISKLTKVLDTIEGAIDLGLMNKQQYAAIRSGGEKICEYMKELEAQPHLNGLIHSDLQKSNLIVYEGAVTPIDFCLCGYGSFYMDLGGLYADFGPAPVREALLQGYRSIRELPEEDMKYIEAFFIKVILLTMATHLHNPKMHEWYIRRTQPICDDYIVPLLQDKRFYKNI